MNAVPVFACNPGPITGDGNWTWFIPGTVPTLIDAGTGERAHLDGVHEALAGAALAQVLVTHGHVDHASGAPALRERFGVTRFLKWPWPDRDTKWPVEWQPLTDGDRVRAGDVELAAIHTPGHAPDHLCFALDGTPLFFSGDHVMSWNTSVVAPPEGNMGAYMRSLDKLMARTSDEVYLPGHGGRLYQPQRVVKAFILHRRMREDAILSCIRDGRQTIPEIVEIVYRGLDPRLVNAASLSVAAHVEHLVDRGLVVSDGPPTKPDRLSAV